MAKSLREELSSMKRKIRCIQCNENNSGGGDTFTGIETTDTATIDFTGNGTISSPLQATVSVVSATQSGIVDNTSLQELGGVDKLINGLRVGRGNNNDVDSVAFGLDTLKVSLPSGLYNSAIGSNVLSKNTSGYRNTGIGCYSLVENTTGVYNSALGINTLQKNTTGSRNIGVGTSLSCNTTGQRNTGIGFNAGYANVTGSFNTYIGNSAGYDNGRGNYNVAIGYQTLSISNSEYLSAGSTQNLNRNIFIGSTIQGAVGLNDTLAIDNKGATVTNAVNALIYGGFSVANRFVKINGEFSVNSANLATADATYTKNIVAKADGSFGWEDRGKVIDTRDNSSKSFWTGSQAQYNAIATKDSKTIYVIL